MKIPSLLLTLSMTANVALLAWLFVPRADVENSPAGKSLKTDSSASKDGAGGRASVRRAKEPLWQWLSPGGDLAAVVARLRAAGLPPYLVRAIISALVAEKFDAERYKIDDVALHTPYWKMWTSSYMDPKVGPALRKLQRDQQDMINRLLGDGALDDGSEEAKAWQELSMGKLSPEKQEQVRLYRASQMEKLMQIYSASQYGGAMLSADREKIAALDKSERDGLSAFLTPAEANEFTMRSSNAASELKWRLGPFRATEEEYRTIFPLYQAYLDQFPVGTSPSGSANGSIDPTQKIARDTMMAQLASALGPQRADELNIALDPKYTALNLLASRLDLPLSASRQVFDVQQDIQQRATAIRNDATLAPDARADQLAALAHEASTKISATLGSQRGFDAYKQNGGQWLLSLTPPPKT